MAAGVDDILNDLIARVNRVRRWLLALSVLRIAALGLACVSLYIGAYAWLDHHVHFGTLGRVSALALFFAMVAVGLYFIVRVLGRDMTYAHAANYIEGKRSFDQQLVAAVEYYEGRGDYPYSKALAAQLVRQVDGATRDYRFDSTIGKWQGYLLSGFVLLCVCVVGLFVRQNVLYISSYLARLLRPFSAVQPVPATVLESPMGDMVAGVDAPVTFDVAVQGRVPESVALVVTRRDPNDANEPSPADSERIELAARTDSDGRTRFTATKSFDAAGRFEYRFETADARSDSHAIRVCELPSIQKVTAKVFPPSAPQGGRPQDVGAARDLPLNGVEVPGLQGVGQMSATRDPSVGDKAPVAQDADGLPATRGSSAQNEASEGQDAGETAGTWGQPYEVELTDEPLAVLAHSRIELTAKASTPLREATVTGPDGQPRTQSLDGADNFGFEFTADAPSSIGLSAVSSDGLAGGEAKELRVVLKSDDPPQFKLTSPEGDYLATDVASIPIVLEVTDDFGLESAELVCEFPGRGPVVLKSASPQGARQTSVTHVLELEQYDLHVGDGVLFYARARDVDTGHRPADANLCSEVYFIEIRPYRQYWHPQPGGNQPSSMPGFSVEDLMAVLEYTRAVVKKTWTLARSPGDAAEDRPKLEALSGDVQYCATLLAKIRDDPEAGLGEGDKAVINRVLESYEQARRHLDDRDAKAALPPVQDAYRILRMFIDELHLKWTPPQSGQSAPQETPERIKLQEQPQEPKVEAERIESRLEEMQQKIDSLSRQQQSLKADLARAMQQEKDAKAAANSTNKTGSGKSAGEKSQGQPGNQQDASAQQSQSGTQAGAGEQKSQGEGDASQSSGSEGQSGSSQSSGSEGQSGSSESSGSEGQGSSSQSAGSEGQSGSSPGGQGGQPGQSPSEQSGGGEGGQAGSGQSGRDGQGGQQGQSSEAQGESSGDRQSGEGDGNGSGSMEGARPNESGRDAPGSREGQGSSDGPGSASAQTDARMRMLQAKQKALREQASELSEDMGGLPVSEHSPQGRASRQAKGHLDEAVETMKQFEERLADARYESGDPSKADRMADLAESAARRLADAGQAIRRGLPGEGDGSSGKAQEMAEQLARDAEAYDESLSEAEKQKMQDRLKAAQQLLESMAGAQWTTMSGGGGPGSGHVYTNDPHASAADTARLLARQFWSVALEGKKSRSRSVEQEPSDVEFFEAENDFFESAARFKPQGVEK